MGGDFKLFQTCPYDGARVLGLLASNCLSQPRSPDHLRKPLLELAQGPLQGVPLGGLVKHQPLVALHRAVVVVGLWWSKQPNRSSSTSSPSTSRMDAHALVRQKVTVLDTELDRTFSNDYVASLCQLVTSCLLCGVARIGIISSLRRNVNLGVRPPIDNGPAV